jgi:hypothetical protein
MIHTVSLQTKLETHTVKVQIVVVTQTNILQNHEHGFQVQQWLVAKVDHFPQVEYPSSAHLLH